MSNTSVTSSKRDAQREEMTKELLEELETVKALNSSLKTYLQHLRAYKKNLSSMNENCKQLSKVNHQWMDTLNLIKQMK